MAVDILWSDIVGEGTLDEGGYVGDLMEVMRAHIDESVRLNRLQQSDAGQVYASLIPTAVNGAIKFAMEEQLIEAQIDKATADAVTASITADSAYARLLADLERVYGMNYTLDVDDQLVLGSLVTGDFGKMYEEEQLVKADVKLTNRKVL